MSFFPIKSEPQSFASSSLSPVESQGYNDWSSAFDDTREDDFDNESLGSGSFSSRKRKRDRDRNRLACKLFREKRKKEVSFLVERNDLLEKEQVFLRARIAELQNEVQIYSRKALDDLDTENQFLKGQVEKHRKCVVDILNMTQDITQALTHGPEERAQVVATGVDCAVSQVIGMGYASTDWNLGQPVMIAGHQAQVRYQLLPFESTTVAQAHRVNIRIDISLPKPSDAVQNHIWRWISAPANDLVAPTGNLVHAVDLNASPPGCISSAQPKMFRVDTQRTNRCSYSLVSQKETEIFASSIWPVSDPYHFCVPEIAQAKVCVRNVCHPGFVSKLGVVSPSELQRAEELSVFTGAIIQESPLSQEESHVILLGSYPLRQTAHVSAPTIDSHGALNLDFLEKLQTLLPPYSTSFPIAPFPV